MKLTFLGTKGFIEESSKKHKFHSSLLVKYKGFKLLIDHGLLSQKLNVIKPNAVLITHGHPDTFKWLKEDEEYSGKIYLTRETKKLSKYQKNFAILELNKWIKIGPFQILPYRVVHSINAPAVGFKIKGNKTLIYNSDLVVMKDKSVIRDVDLYIGDGSSLRGNLVRRKGNKLFGHARMSTQVNWCKKYKISKLIFTHLGKEALRIGDKKVEQLLHQPGMEITIAKDRMRYVL